MSSEDLHRLSPLARLRELRLEYAPSVTDAGLEGLARLPHLATLSLSGTKVTDAGMPSVARLPHLDHLDLCGTAV